MTFDAYLRPVVRNVARRDVGVMRPSLVVS